MRRSYYLGFLALVLVLLVAGGQSCARAKKQPGASAGAPTRAQLQQRLQALQWDWEILQKDQPPQNETTGFRLSLKRAEQNLAEGRLKPAAADLAEAEAWMKDARVRYYRQRQAAVSAKDSREDGEALMDQARDFWKRSPTAAGQGQELLSQKYQVAALAQGELALLACAGKRDRVLDSANLCLELADWYRQAGMEDDAQRVSSQGRNAIQTEIEALRGQMEAIFAGELGYQPEQLKKSFEAFSAAREELEQSNQKILYLVQKSSALYPGQIQAEDQAPRIPAWAAPFLQHFQRVARQNQIKTPIADKERLAQRERQRLQAVRELSQACMNAIPLSTPGLQIVEFFVETRGPEVVVRGRIINNSGQTLYRLRMAVCGEMVASEVIDLNRPTLLNENQESFTLPLAHYELGDFMATQFKIGPHQLLLIYDDSQDVEHREYLALPNN
jgi:hypothetical protein